MKARCLYPRHISYKYYGGRGVTFADEWNKFEPFMEWALANGYDESLSLDRVDNWRGYGPDNCRWVTPKEQMANTRAKQAAREML
jgi:hypothetical protein